MNVICIFPITNNMDKYPIILKKFQDQIVPGLTLLGATGLEIKFAGTDYKFVPINQSFSIQGKPKGEGILECLKNCSSNPDCVIMCDGSGAIPYEYIVDLFQELVSDLSISAVMANRIKNKAISEKRLFIEQFEIFILKKYHNCRDKIPDGQCGLWGYKTGKVLCNGFCKPEINLTAKSYEIELDLLSELLEKDLKFSFIDVELPERKVASSFTFENNLNKMKFLLEKYPKLKDCLPLYINEFESIPKNIKRLQDETMIENWEKYKNELRTL